MKTEIPLTSSTDGLLGGSVQYYTMQQTLYISSLKLAQVKGQSLLVGNLVSTDISLFWQEQPVSRYTQLRKEYDRSIYAKHLIWEIYFWSFLQIFYLVRENKIWSINQRKFICHLKYIHSLSKTEWFDIEA